MVVRPKGKVPSVGGPLNKNARRDEEKMLATKRIRYAFVVCIGMHAYRYRMYRYEVYREVDEVCVCRHACAWAFVCIGTHVCDEVDEVRLFMCIAMHVYRRHDFLVAWFDGIHCIMQIHVFAVW